MKKKINYPERRKSPAWSYNESKRRVALSDYIIKNEICAFLVHKIKDYILWDERYKSERAYGGNREIRQWERVEGPHHAREIKARVAEAGLHKDELEKLIAMILLSMPSIFVKSYPPHMKDLSRKYRDINKGKYDCFSLLLEILVPEWQKKENMR